MKKIFLLLSVCICCASISFAQVKVDSNGKIGIGTTTPNANYKTTIDGGDLLMKFGSATRWLEGIYHTVPASQYSPFTEIVEISPVTAGSYPAVQYALGKNNPFQYGSFDMLFCNISFQNFSDERLKRNINSLSFDRNTFAKLQPVSYEIRNAAMQQAKGENIEPTYTPQYGFLAQELEKIYPHLVLKDEDSGYLRTKPLEMIPILVAAIQDQQKQIDVQQKQIDELRQLVGAGSMLKSNTDVTGISAIDGVTGNAALYQNIPNPFNQSTEIKFYIPENAKSAQLCIYNLQGKQIKQIVIAERGEGSQVISGSELTAGMYLYALIVDTKEVDTKRMILTE